MAVTEKVDEEPNTCTHDVPIGEMCVTCAVRALGSGGSPQADEAGRICNQCGGHVSDNGTCQCGS